jgi:hypothetical protein
MTGVELACRTRGDLELMREHEILDIVPEETRTAREPLRWKVDKVMMGMEAGSQRLLHKREPGARALWPQLAHKSLSKGVLVSGRSSDVELRIQYEPS